ncbi:hypothetical protein [Nocardioides marmoraquaticus]
MLSERGREVVVGAWVLLLCALLLGPALAPGFLLTFDMVWVPDLALTRDAVGVGSALPRAVPSDAVVAVIDQVVPGSLLQKVVLLGALVGGGVGVARLLRPELLLARLVAAAAYVWNPLVVERLVMGHWPLLVALGVAPWLWVCLRSWRSGPPPAALWWLVPLGSLAASSGLTTALLVAAATPWRRARAVGLLLLVGNLPWIVTGLLHAGSATTDPAAAARFALAEEGVVPGPVAALTLGGIWNSEVVPGSREGALAWLVPVVVLPLAVVGLRSLAAELDRRTWWALVGCWAVGWVGATLTWAAPSVTATVASAVPGGGVLRDGGRLLVLCAPLLALALGRGAQAVVLALPSAARVGAGLGLLALPVALLPGVAWGAGAGLRAVSYPADHEAARAVVADVERRGDTVLLPFTSYRAPSWNGGRKVLDPTGRYLGVDVVQDDVLAIDGEPLAGEDPRAATVRAALEDAADPVSRRAALERLGIGVAVTDLGAGAPPDVEGTVLLDGDTLLVQRLPGAVAPPGPPRWWWPPVLVAWAAYAAGLAVPLARAARRGWRRHLGHEV